jgi:hypothetical protein
MAMGRTPERLRRRWCPSTPRARGHDRGVRLDPGLSIPIKWPSEPLLGLKSTYVPISGISRLSNEDGDYLAALRRDEAAGAMELVSIRNGLLLRLSDFVNEHDFADFKYAPNDGWREVHRMLRTDEGWCGRGAGRR